MKQIDSELFVRRHGEGMDDLQLSIEFSTSIDLVKYYRKKFNLVVNKRMPSEEVDKENRKRMGLYLDGKSDMEIAEKCNVSSTTIHSWRRTRKLLPNKKSYFNGTRKSPVLCCLEDSIGVDVKRFLEV